MNCFKDFTRLDYFRCGIMITCFMFAGAFFHCLSPFSRDDHIVRTIAGLCVGVLLILLGLIIFISLQTNGTGLDAKLGQRTPCNICLIITSILLGIVILTGLIIVFIQLTKLEMPDATEELDQCQNPVQLELEADVVVEDSKSCIEKFTGDNYLKICDEIFEKNKVRKSRTRNRKVEYKFGNDSKYCVTTEEFYTQTIAGGVVIINLICYSVLLGIIFNLMRNEYSGVQQNTEMQDVGTGESRRT